MIVYVSELINEFTHWIIIKSSFVYVQEESQVLEAKTET